MIKKQKVKQTGIIDCPIHIVCNRLSLLIE